MEKKLTYEERQEAEREERFQRKQAAIKHQLEVGPTAIDLKYPHSGEEATCPKCNRRNAMLVERWVESRGLYVCRDCYFACFRLDASATAQKSEEKTMKTTTKKSTAKKSTTLKKAPKAVKAVKQALSKLIAESPTVTEQPAKKSIPVTLKRKDVERIKELLPRLNMPATAPWPTCKMVQTAYAKLAPTINGSRGDVAALAEVRDELYTLLPVKLPAPKSDLKPIAAKSEKSAKSTAKKSDAKSSKSTEQKPETTTEQKPAEEFKHDPRVLAMFPVGSTIVRPYQPRGSAPIEIRVEVKKDGYYFNGARYANLSKLGFDITKRVGLDGPRFFGIRAVPKKEAK